MSKYVYAFAEGNKDLKDLLGGKGANLAEMAGMGLPVPPGFIVSTEACRAYLDTGTLPAELSAQVDEYLIALEKAMGKTLGAPEDPLLVAVRSGSKFSMPGMMETVLDVGLNDSSVIGLAKASDDERFAWDSYRRLIQMFGKTVLGIDGETFRRGVRRGQEVARHHQRPGPRRVGPAAGRRVLQGAWSASRPAGSSRRTRASSWTWRSTPSSTRGTRRAPGSTGAASTSRTTWAPRSTSWRWCSATWAPTPAPASPSPATRPPASAASTATTCPTPRARTSSPASATRCRWPSSSSSTRRRSTA